MSMRHAVITTIAGVFLVGQGSAISAQLSSSQSGQRANDFAFGVRAGTLGLGVEVSKLLVNHVGLRVGGDFASITLKDVEKTDITYDVKVKWQAWSALLDFYPAPRGSFHLTGGLITNPVKITATALPTGGSFEINNHTYTTSEVGTLTGTGEFSSVLPYVGLGVGTAASQHGGLAFVFDLGVAIGKPKISLSATGAAGNALLQSDLNAQIATTQDDLNKLPVYPVLAFGLIYRF